MPASWPRIRPGTLTCAALSGPAIGRARRLSSTAAQGVPGAIRLAPVAPAGAAAPGCPGRRAAPGDRHRAVVPGGDGAPRRPGPPDDRGGERLTDGLLVSAKRASFGDRDIATLTGLSQRAVAERRVAIGLRPGFAMVDTCAAEFAAETPYFYATYAATGSPPEAPPVDPAGGAGHRLRPGAHRPGHRVRLLRRAGRRCAPRGSAGRR